MLNTTNAMAMRVPIDDLIIGLANTSAYRLGKRRLHPQLHIRFHCVDDLRQRGGFIDVLKHQTKVGHVPYVLVSDLPREIRTAARRIVGADFDRHFELLQSLLYFAKGSARYSAQIAH
jgi:hypothetical protein